MTIEQKIILRHTQLLETVFFESPHTKDKGRERKCILQPETMGSEIAFD
jgi:hypothetical protein